MQPLGCGAALCKTSALGSRQLLQRCIPEHAAQRGKQLSQAPRHGSLLAHGQHTSRVGRSLFTLPPCPHAVARRGKRLQKHYTVFLASVSDTDRDSYVPRLNHEHRAWRWFSLQQMQPTIGAEAVRGEAVAGVQAGTGVGTGAGAGEEVVLHPVVQLLLQQRESYAHLQQLMRSAAATCTTGGSS